MDSPAADIEPIYAETPATVEHVEWAFRIFAPEEKVSAAKIAEISSKCPTTESVRHYFLTSQSFRERNANLLEEVFLKTVTHKRERLHETEAKAAALQEQLRSLTHQADSILRNSIRVMEYVAAAKELGRELRCATRSANALIAELEIQKKGLDRLSAFARTSLNVPGTN